MKKTGLYFLGLFIIMLLLSACGLASEVKYTPLPQVKNDGEGSLGGEAELSEKAFRQVVDLRKYDNPYFKTDIKDGKLEVEIEFLELWDDFADINSEDESAKKEGERRNELNEILKKPRTFSAAQDITAVWELPCSTKKDAGDARVVIKTEDGKFYLVDLVSEENMGKIEAKELAALSGADNIDLLWATTGMYTAEEKNAGDDFLIAKGEGAKLVAEIPLNCAVNIKQ